MQHWLRRILFYLVAIWAALTINFFMPRLAPGDPLTILVANIQEKGGHVGPAYLHALQAELGYNNEPLWQQYLNYLWELLHGNLGISVQFSFEPVTNVIARGIMWTLGLGLAAVIISFALGCILGTIAAWRRGRFFDLTLTTGLNFIAAIPYFWLALVLLYVFGSTLHWFPVVGGYDSLEVDPGWSMDFIASVLYHAVLPACTIVLVSLGGWMLTMRNTMVTTLSEDYVLLARAKGLKTGRVMFAYAARNAILPNIAGFAIALGFVVGGQLLTEMVFSYPGIGYTLLLAVQNQDYALMQGIFLYISLAILAANFLAEIFYAILDPRIRQGRSA
ncbi:ABC transporter permease [Ktedonosporobacter rubrisoli]|uniref:ABC transporter permease n=1 Tax=Ktedonosporobacter rubrisoli TaxID=2509675 RepID=A0A4P6JRY7_KTERU|nr:ABC transporter permease [Ktedonosporobacter rubrisoli]QBD78134.1 ABC transporter permease [Ktedonosporobacter rubrisoli]